MTKTLKKPELLMPAGNLDRLKTAFLYGADAVYIGTPDMSLAVNSTFSHVDVSEGNDLSHSIYKKVYLNILTKYKTIKSLLTLLKTL
jgi:putative protease